MALPILDGNQTSVTLATTVSGGAHYPNHIIASSVTISSLPTIAGTVTVGNSVTISSLPAISGTVTANIGSALPSGTNRIGVVTIGGGTVTIGAGTAQIGSVTASLAGWELLGSRDFFADGSSWNFNGSTISLYSSLGIIFGDGGSAASIQAFFVSGQDNNIYWSDLNGARTKIISSGAGLLTTQAIPADLSISTFVPPSQSQTASLYGKKENVLPLTNTQLRGSAVTVSGTVTVGSLPVNLSTTTIGGSARLNVTLSSATTIGATAPSYGNLYGGSDGTNLRAISVDTSGRTVVTGSVSVANTVPVSGTVTANISGTVPVSISSVTIGNTVTVAGTVTANVASTTVTISAQPSGALTTRFGSVTTANTSQITTAVTNTSRKYLLAQNISTGTVTIGIGFSPTTTQGIQLTAGAGLTFDSFVPTGAVYWLGATTGAAYTILEG